MGLRRHLGCVLNSTVLVLRQTIYGGRLLLVIALVIVTRYKSDRVYEPKCDKRHKIKLPMLTLSGSRHFAILHGTGGGGCDPPRDWLLSELELRFKNQRVACHEMKPLKPEFKILGQPVTSEVRSMTQKWPKCNFADNFVSEQARAAI